LDPFYRDRFYLGPFLPGPFLPDPFYRDRFYPDRFYRLPTGGEVMSKITVASFFLGHFVYLWIEQFYLSLTHLVIYDDDDDDIDK